MIDTFAENTIKNLQKNIVKLEKERYDKAVKLENTREQLLAILSEKGILESDRIYYDLRSEYHQLHIPVEVMGRKYNTNVMLINMGMSWESFENALFNQLPDKKRIDERIAVFKADCERVRKMFKEEYVMEIKHD